MNELWSIINHQLTDYFLFYSSQKIVLNQVVIADDFFFESEEKNKFVSEYNNMTQHDMHADIQKCRRICYRLLGLRMGFFERMTTVRGPTSVELDTMLEQELMAGLRETSKLDVFQMMGAIVHPLMQNDDRLIDADMCTREQYNEGREDLLDRMSNFYERVSENVTTAKPKAVNKWDKKRW